MSEELTGLQLEILKALRDHEEKCIAKVFSMDKFYNKFHSDIERNKFRRSYSKLEHKGYIQRTAETMDEKGDIFGCYEIANLGLLCLDELNE